MQEAGGGGRTGNNSAGDKGCIETALTAIETNIWHIWQPASNEGTDSLNGQGATRDIVRDEHDKIAKVA
jgi:hypothetical protein